METIFVISAFFAGFLFLLSRQASVAVWLLAYVLTSAFVLAYCRTGLLINTVLMLILLVLCVCSVKSWRRKLLTRFIFAAFCKTMPSMSSTEKEALEAGTVGFEAALFSGAPDFQKLLNSPVIKLNDEEQEFLAGPVNTLCRMIDDWQITHQLTDMPQEMWQFIKENRFFGLIIPKQYGGLDFSATAQTMIYSRVYGRSISVATTISVPNALGPAELLLKYGTDEQKTYYLPRLADGREIPSFALTGPQAGSDAASIPDKGIVCRQIVNGQEIIGIRLTWQKRYITFCPVATLIGLAFRLYDPENILGLGEDIGISCALVPADTEGVIRGRRHFPLNTAFLNGPTQGHNVFVPLDCLIGGVKMAGHGWRMLMECLSAGRAVSLPSSANGGAQFLSMACGAYARIRYQFGQPIASFEGIEEPLARIAGSAYLIKAAVKMTVNAIDRGERPSVAGAILKYQTTERSRSAIMDAMDIHGGKGICLGPKNYLGRSYQNAQISITVEGANILTRSLIIFGQGVIRCHPYIYREISCARANDLSGFDEAFWGHMAFVLSNVVRSFCLSISNGWGSRVPSAHLKSYYQQLNLYATKLALMTDFAMLTMGGALKRHEKLSARFGDLLSNLYLASAVLKNFHDDGYPEEDLPLIHWTFQQLLFEADEAVQGILDNFSGLFKRMVLRLLANPLSRRRKPPSDRLGAQVAKLLTRPSATRDRLISDVFREAVPNCPAGELEAAFLKVCAVESLEKTVFKAAKTHQISGLTMDELILSAREKNIINAGEAQLLQEAEKARQAVIAVDDFAHEELARAPHVGRSKRT